MYHVERMRHTIGSPETPRVKGDPIVLPHPVDVILYARSSYFYNDFSDIILILYCFGF